MVFYLNLAKTIYHKSTAGIILKGQKLKPFALKSETKQGYLPSMFLFNIVLEILVRAIRRIQVGNKVKLSLFGNDMKLYTKDHKNSTKRPLDLITKFSHIAGY